MQFRVLTNHCAFLSLQITILLTNEIASAENEMKSNQASAIGSSELDPMKQLQAMQETISKLQTMQEMMSAQISLIESDDINQKNEIQRIQRESELKEHQMRNQMNDLADENQNLNQLLVKIMSLQNQMANESTSKSDGYLHVFPDYRREFNQYMAETGGVTYVRWGRTTCQSPAYPLYTGYAASGSSHEPTSNGGSTDIVCLHAQPQFVSIVPNGNSYLFGLEYDFPGLPFSTINNGGASLLYNDMPCTVCHVSSKSHQFMLPGRNSCPSGWVREYWGYLVSSWSSRLKLSMICLDEAPETVPGGSSYAGGSMVMPVEATCKAIYCPPYKAGNELTCAVCSK